MKSIILISILILLALPTQSAEVYTCIKNAFAGNCKTKLYECTNNP